MEELRCTLTVGLVFTEKRVSILLLSIKFSIDIVEAFYLVSFVKGECVSMSVIIYTWLTLTQVATNEF